MCIRDSLNAVQRVRFASDAVVIPDQGERVAVLQTPLPPELVLLSEQSDHLTDPAGATAVIHRVDDQLDNLEISLASTGPGWLVIADAMQSGWAVTVNDVPGALVHADHALVGVAIPEGSHVVRLTYEPPGLKTGVGLSVISLFLFLLLAWGASRKRALPQLS